MWDDDWLDLGVPLPQLPREARLVSVLHGSTGAQAEVLGWVALRLFSHTGQLADGDQLLGLWQQRDVQTTGTWLSNINADNSPLLLVGRQMAGRERGRRCVG